MQNDKIDTPYFVLDKKKLDQAITELKLALENLWPNSIIGYSYKTNSLEWVIRYMEKAGVYAEVVSGDEYLLAKSIGYEERIVYNGPVKTKKTFIEALAGRNYVNIDSNREIEWLADYSKNNPVIAKVGVRINFDLESICPSETQCGSEGGRFGFSYENGEFIGVVNKIKSCGVKVDGIHLHCSSKTRSINIYKASAIMACKIKEKYGLNFKYIDIGGGFFGGVPGKPNYADYICAIKKELIKSFDPKITTLIVEPGTSLICAPINYVTSVIDVKDTYANRIVTIDGSRINIDPLMAKNSYTYEIEYADNSERTHCDKQVISGFTCMEHDRLYELRNSLELIAGDKIIFNKVGAYTICLSPLFIGYFPAVYLLDENNYKIIRKKWTCDMYKQGSVVEE